MPVRASLSLLVLLAVGHRTVVAQQSADTLALTIEEAVTRALRNGSDSRIAATQVEAAEAQITSSRAAGLPQVRLAGTYTQVIENARATIVGQVFGQSFTYNSNVNISQSLFQGGRVVAGARLAAEARGAARFNEREVRALVAVDVQRAYLQAVLAGDVYDIQQRNLQLADDRLKQVQLMEGAGRAARYDVLRARVERANLEPAVISARNDMALAFLDLKRILRIAVEQPISLTSGLDVEGLIALVDRVAADSSADPARAAVRAAELTRDARRQAIAVARADLLPTASVFFQTGYLALPSSNGFPTIWGAASTQLCPDGSPATRICQNNGWFADRNFGIQVTWPLFDGLRAKGNIDLAQTQAKIAELQLDQQRDRVATERAAARAELERARSAFSAIRQNSSEAEEAYRLATLRFDRGLATQLEATDAQLALLTARLNEVRAVHDLYLAIAELARARGLDIPLPPTRPGTTTPPR